MGPDIKVKSSSITGSKGKFNWYAWGNDNSSTTHNSSFKLKLSGKGSYNLIRTVGSTFSSVSNFILLAIIVWLFPKLR